jgi:hypothetical protein
MVWWWTRKFPIWGLVPLGLLFKTVWDLGYRLLNGELDSSNPLWLRLMELERRYPDAIRIVMTVGIVTIMVLLIVLIARRQHISRGAWVWMGVYVLLGAFYLAANYWTYYYNQSYLSDWKLFLITIVPPIFYEYAGLLLLILLGALLTKRHGRLAMLLPMGYLLPTVLYGRFADYWVGISEQVVNVYLLLICVTVLTYRFVIALAAPLWIVRSASGKTQEKASLIALLVTLGIQALMNIGIGVFMALFYQYSGWGWIDWYNTIAAELVAAAGIGAALSLYGDAVPAQAAPEPKALAAETGED